VICSQAAADVDSIRGLTDAPFEIDKGNDLAHLVFRFEASTKQIQ
jgi:hypothetical protein